MQFCVIEYYNYYRTSIFKTNVLVPVYFKRCFVFINSVNKLNYERKRSFFWMLLDRDKIQTLSGKQTDLSQLFLTLSFKSEKI